MAADDDDDDENRDNHDERVICKNVCMFKFRLLFKSAAG